MNLFQYRLILIILHCFILFDLCVNCFATIFKGHATSQLVVFVLQDLCIILTTIIIFLMFSSTSFFQAGLFGSLTSFQLTLVTSVAYLVLSISLHVWTVSAYLPNFSGYIHVWTNGLLALFSIQRIVAVVYYYLCKRVLLSMACSKYQRNSEWLHRKLTGR